MQQPVKEEKKKRIQDKEEERCTDSRSMTPPLSHSRSSHTSTKFQGCQPKVETLDPTMHGMVNCCSRMSGWPRFDGTFKNYPAFKREWERFQQLIPQGGLVRSFRENCIGMEIAHRIRRLEMMPEVWERLDSSYALPTQFTSELMSEIPVSPKIEDREYKKLLVHYEKLKDNIGERLTRQTEKTYFLLLHASTK